VAGPQYPGSIEWPANVERIEHLPPAEHPEFYAASRWTVNVTRSDMRQAGWSPSVRLFEAAACGVPVISDSWPGLDQLLEPGREILLPNTTEEVLAILDGGSDPARIGAAARRRILDGHTNAHRAEELERILAEVRVSQPAL
jgi:spore maturation protein CgeB